jgi:hypothetical protein
VGARRHKRVVGTGGEDAVSEQSKVNHGPDWRQGDRIATYTVELDDHGPEA